MLFSFGSNFFMLQNQANPMCCFIYSISSDLETWLSDFIINFAFFSPIFLATFHNQY